MLKPKDLLVDLVKGDRTKEMLNVEDNDNSISAIQSSILSMAAGRIMDDSVYRQLSLQQQYAQQQSQLQYSTGNTTQSPWGLFGGSR